MFYIVTGGSASGKSEYAESLAISSDARQRFYIATMKPWDEEGHRRIQKHRAMRAGKALKRWKFMEDVQIFPWFIRIARYSWNVFPT